MLKSFCVLIVITLLAFILSSGCIGSQNPSTEQSDNFITNAPTLESTFASPTYSGATSSKHTSTPVPTIGATATPDPVIGIWSLQNAPYQGTARFISNGQGIMTGNIGFASSSKSFAWSNTGVNADGDKTYHIALADGSGDTMDATWFSSNGTMICGVLPEGSYLIKGM